MRRTHQLDRWRTVFPSLVAALLAALGASSATPIPAVAQGFGERPLIFDQYLSRAELDQSVVGTRTRLEGVGLRLTRPLAAPAPDRPARLTERVALGGFVTYAPSTDPGLTTWHYGVLADVPLRTASPTARVEPLASLGVGAFNAQRALGANSVRSPGCVAPTDVAVPRAAVSCIFGLPQERPVRRTDVAVSPAVGVRVGLGRTVALRADVRDVIVYRGAARHNYELATGLSFVR